MARRRTPPPEATDTIRVLLVESRALTGVGVREVVDREPDMEIVAEVRSPTEALPVVEERSPDVVVLDVELQEPAATAASRRLTQEASAPAIVVLGGDDDDASIFEAIEVGATGHVPAVAEPTELVAVIRRVAEGEDPLKEELIGRPDLIDRIVEAVREGFRQQDMGSANPLTGREMEILRHVAEGLRNRQIAERLDLTEQTVKNHLSSILHKLGAPNRTQAVTVAVRQGFLVLDESALEIGAGAETRGR
jgi:DNA-binding NarL/FixJ family response regulator